MKIITNTTAYIQNRDIYLASHFLSKPVPLSVYKEAFKNDFFLSSEGEKFIKCTDSESIEYIKSLDWVVDYYSVKDLDNENFMRLYGEAVKEYKDLKSIVNILTSSSKKLKALLRAKLLAHKLRTLQTIAHFKAGTTTIELPEGIEPPMSTQEIVFEETYDENKEPKKKNRLKNFFVRMFFKE